MYRGRCKQTGLEVAIKMVGCLDTTVVCQHFVCNIQIDKKLMQAAGMTSRVRNEVEIHSQLKHPAVLEVGIK